MRALTLTQPWAGLVASGIKLVENRPRRMIKREDFGKPFAIHASREQVTYGTHRSVFQRVFEIAPELCTPWTSDQQRALGRLQQFTSKVIAVATVDREVFDRSGLLQGEIARDLGEQSRWFFGPIGYVLRDVFALPTPVPCRGFQGFWTLPADVERQVAEQLR